jgi:hypothetical protein
MTQMSADTPFSCTIMSAASGAGHATKEIIAHPVTGLPIKNQARNLGIWRGEVQHVQLAGLADLGRLLPTLTKRQALIHGVPLGSTPETILPLVMEEKLSQRGTPANAIARTLTSFAYTIPHLLMFDIDPDPYERYTIHNAEALMALLATIWPVFADVGYLSTVSTSSAIYDKKDDRELVPPSGLHVYLLAQGDVARFKDLAAIKFWCADTGYCRLASPNKRTGVAAILERCLTDLSVFSPERLDYVAGADLSSRLPFVQRRPTPALHEGTILDLDSLPDVTSDERAEYADRLAAEKARIAPERITVCTAHVKATEPTLSDAAVHEEVTRRIFRANHDWLAPDHVIDLARGGTLLVQDLTRKHHGLACADPAEPDYGPNHAKIYWDADKPHWVICSLAHGFKHLFFSEPQAPHPPDEDEDDFADLLANAPTPETLSSSKGKLTQAEILLDLAATAHLVHTTEGRRFAVVPVNGHTEVLAIGEKGSAFRDWLLRRFRATQEGIPNTNALSQAMEALAADARFIGERRDVYTRLASHDGKLYLDLANEAWQVVEITKEGWQVIAQPPVYFRRPNGMLPLPLPNPDGTLEDFYALLPVEKKTDEAHLILGWLVATFQPTGAFAHLGIHGEQGSTKSTLTRHLRRLVDPNKAPARSAPQEERDLAITATNSAIVALENLSHVPDWLSDVLCALSTGAGFSTRSLYTDDEEMIFAMKRPVVMNGIAEVAVRGDLIDRCVFVTLPAITEQARKSEAEVDRVFAKCQPKALGALLDVVCTALHNQGKGRFAALPRMADFALWVEAASPALGWERGEFLRVYNANRANAAHMELEASLVATHLLAWLAAPDNKEKLLMKELLQMLTDAATAFGQKKEPPGWPKSGQALRAHLKRYAPALRREGWTLVDHPKGERGRTVSFVKADEVADEVCQTQKFVRSSSSHKSLNGTKFADPDEDDELSLPLYIQKKREEKKREEGDKGGKEAKREGEEERGGEKGEASSKHAQSSSGSSVRHNETETTQTIQVHEAIDAWGSTVGDTQPAFTNLRLSDPFCGVCQRNVSYRVLVQFDGGEQYFCEACDTLVGTKAAPSPTAAADNLDLEGVNIDDIPF